MKLTLSVCVQVLPLLYLAGLTLLPRQFRQERAGGLNSHNARVPADGEGSYVPLDDRDRDHGGRETEETSSSTRLLFEVGRDEEGDEEEEREELEMKKDLQGKV